jgi:hypothetical protein
MTLAVLECSFHERLIVKLLFFLLSHSVLPQSIQTFAIMNSSIIFGHPEADCSYFLFDPTPNAALATEVESSAGMRAAKSTPRDRIPFQPQFP